MPGIHTESEEIQKLYYCIENELSYVLKLLSQDYVVPLQLQLAIKALERREHALHMRVDHLRKTQVDLGVIPKKLSSTILNEILQLEQNAAMRAKVDAAMQKGAVFFACLERIKGEVSPDSLQNTKASQQKNGRRVEPGDNATDHRRRET